MTTKTQSASQPFLRPLRAEAATQIDAAVVRLAIDDERASLRLMSHDHVLAQVTDLPTERVDAVHVEAAKHLPAALRNRATRGVSGAALADGHRMLVLLCLHTGLNGPAIVMIRRMLDQPANTFAEWIGVTPETLSRWEQGHRPVNPMAKRSIELAFRALIAPSSGTSWVMAGIPEPPVVVSPQRPHLTFAQGHRWLRLLDPLFNEALLRFEIVFWAHETANISTRHQAAKTRSSVVSMRHFRCGLPLVLYRQAASGGRAA